MSVLCLLYRIGEKKPLTKELQSLVIPKVSTHYNEIGIELFHDDDLSRLDEIAKANPTDYRKACTAMFQHWLGADYDATWNALIAALRSPGIQLISVSHELVKQLNGWLLFIVSCWLPQHVILSCLKSKEPPRQCIRVNLP